MPDEPKKASPTSPKPPAPKPQPRPSSGSGGEYDNSFEVLLLIVIVIFLVVAFSGGFVVSLSSINEIPFIRNTIIILKIISGTIGLLSVVGIIYILPKTLKFRTLPLPGEEESTREEAEQHGPVHRNEWEALHTRLERATDQDAAMIIIEADTLADRILKDAGLVGDTMGDRMKTLGEQKFKNIDNLWEAHKIRNQIAHEGGKGITYSDAVYALDKYEKALKELEAI
jgi:hypothetical protein